MNEKIEGKGADLRGFRGVVSSSEGEDQKEFIFEIGKAVTNFGAIENQSFWWIQLFGDDDDFHKAVSLLLSNRISLLEGLIKDSALSDEDEENYLDLWDKVKTLSQKGRNIICHNPIIHHYKNRAEDGNPDLIGLIDMRSMRDKSDWPTKKVSDIKGIEWVKIFNGAVIEVAQEIASEFQKLVNDQS